METKNIRCRKSYHAYYYTHATVYDFILQQSRCLYIIHVTRYAWFILIIMTLLVIDYNFIFIIGIHSCLFDSLESNLHGFRFKHVLHESQEPDLAVQV